MVLPGSGRRLRIRQCTDLFHRRDVYKRQEYHKWKFKSKVYIPLMDPITVKRTPVLMGRVEFGLLGHYNKYKKGIRALSSKCHILSYLLLVS